MENPEDAEMKNPGDVDGESKSGHVGYSIENFNNCKNIPNKAKVAFFTYGRFQPGHSGHTKIFMTLYEMAKKHNKSTGVEITKEKTNIYVFVSPSGGPKEKKPNKNPLSPNVKVDLLQHQYTSLPIHFVNMGEAKDKGARPGPGGAVAFLKKCYKNGVMLVGEDRMFAFDWLGKGFLTVEGISRPPRAMSATKVRGAATAAQQTRQQTETFRRAIQFGTVTRSHVNEIKRLIRAAQVKSRLKQLKKSKRERQRGGKRKTRKTRKTRRKRRKTRRRRKRKRKRKTRRRMCKFR